MGIFGNLVRQGLSVIEEAQQRSQQNNPNYSNFYVRPGEKLNIEPGNNIDSGAFYVAPNKQLEIASNTEFKSKGGVVRGVRIATRGAKKAKIY